ncbi:16S rRNA (cytidine1402-2'-O)-methyltransferase [Tangfeifania diversioriginum]|uniref:16S rRNA (Cytidine1402-2'-O)-methyltransferase n=1 Tax=Tangfeifania diversioriginum TaxID=1168035 RepID=A0A1M6D2R8_9BACT|nr:SAM-dependent methyltransferase [Tangfeifania diversioriginum]SHI67489.1 16S rRNA (cytidine1402-2'-O)-methyltransferase [Tangfeifania diversioriginum]
MAKLYLIPNLLSEGDWQNVLPAHVLPVLTQTRYFIVENIRTARRFMKRVNQAIEIDDLTFFELNKHTPSNEIPSFLNPLEKGEDIAVISEAGCPGVADPGAEIVKLAHHKRMEVVPLTGPSSIILSLMASGLNGQNFAFNGYLPVKSAERAKAVKVLEKKAKIEQQTQIFIETPYRNNQLISDLLKMCSSATLLCIAANLTGENEFIATRPIGEWKKGVPDLNKQPAIFLIGY